MTATKGTMIAKQAIKKPTTVSVMGLRLWGFNGKIVVGIVVPNEEFREETHGKRA